MKKTCTKCGKRKAIGAFPLRTRKDGERVPESWCKACKSIAITSWQRRNRDRINLREYGTPEAAERRREQKRAYQRKQAALRAADPALDAEHKAKRRAEHAARRARG